MKRSFHRVQRTLARIHGPWASTSEIFINVREQPRASLLARLLGGLETSSVVRTAWIIRDMDGVVDFMKFNGTLEASPPLFRMINLLKF